MFFYKIYFRHKVIFTFAEKSISCGAQISPKVLSLQTFYTIETTDYSKPTTSCDWSSSTVVKQLTENP